MKYSYKPTELAKVGGVTVGFYMWTKCPTCGKQFKQLWPTVPELKKQELCDRCEETSKL